MSRFSLASVRFCLRTSTAAAALLAVAMVPASNAGASPGYELDGTKPFIATSGEVPHGVAVDQVSQNLYVTLLSTNFFAGSHGQIEQFDASGVPTAHSPFVTGGQDLFAGVAVNPVTQGIYAYQTELSTPLGLLGTVEINAFSSTGTLGTSFNPTKSTGPQLAADPSGRVYYPNDGTDTVQIFDSTGTLKDSVSCAGCPGGGFSSPTGIALDSAGNLYVVDLSGGRVIKFKPAGGSYAYDSVLQSGQGAVAVGVDPADNDVFVGGLVGDTYHVVAYDSSGNQFDDFGAGVVGPPKSGAETAGQIAVNATTHKLYVADSGADKVWVFDRVASIPAPLASTLPASSVGQVAATLGASVDPEGHGLTDCHFEYTGDADFKEHGFTNAVSTPCTVRPGGTLSTKLSLSVTGLLPATTYDYRIVVASNGGTVEAPSQTFTTLAAQSPSVTSAPASGITQTTATLGGSVNPHGGSISSCQFEYTDNASFLLSGFTGATSVACAPAKPSGTASVPVSTGISGLSAATSYRFRVVATNNAGTAEATDLTFATLAETCATNSALCPPPQPPTSPPSPPSQPPTVAPPPPPGPKPPKCRKGFKKKQVRGKTKCVKIKKRGKPHPRGRR